MDRQASLSDGGGAVPPADAVSLLDRARAGLRDGRPALAGRAALRAACLDPAAADGYRLLGNAEIRCGRPPGAARAFHRAIVTADQPLDRDHRNHGMVLELQGDPAAAASHRRAVLIAPDSQPSARRLAEALYRHDRVELCAPWLRTMPAADPHQHVLLGLCRLRGGDPQGAAAAFDAALRAAPDLPPARLGKAEAMIGLGQPFEALALLRTVPAAPEWMGERCFLMAEAGLNSGGGRPAAAGLRTALLFAPDHGRAWRRLAEWRLGDEGPAAAARLLERAVCLNPGDLATGNRLIQCRLDAGERMGASQAARRLLSHRPRRPGDWNHLALRVKAIEGREAALPWLAAACARFPGQPVVHYNHGHTLNQVWRVEPAVPSLRRALLLDPGYAKGWTALSVALQVLFDNQDAATVARRALLIDRKAAAAWLNLGLAERSQGKLAEAVAAMDRAVSLDPAGPNATITLAYTLLMAGEIREGFRLYDRRWDGPDFPSPKRDFPQPEWTGDSLDRKQGLLLYMEQGMGDEIMFSWYLPLVRRRARHLVVECDGRLIPLFERSFPAIQFVPRRSPVHPRTLQRDIVRQAPIGHVPKFFWYELRRHIARTAPVASRPFARMRGHVRPDPARQAHWRSWLEGLAPERLRVGICWRSAVHSRIRDMQYLTPADIAAPFGPDTAVVNLQYDHDAAEAAEIAARCEAAGAVFATPPGIDLRDDLDDLTALTACLDVVVTPLISTAFMAAAAGTPTIVCRTTAAVIWQQLGTDFVPWLPSMRLVFRRPGEPWDAAVAQVRRMLAAMAAAPRETLRRPQADPGPG